MRLVSSYFTSESVRAKAKKIRMSSGAAGPRRSTTSAGSWKRSTVMVTTRMSPAMPCVRKTEMTRRRVAASGAEVLGMDSVYRNAKRGRGRSGHGNLERRMRMQNGENGSVLAGRLSFSEFSVAKDQSLNLSDDEPIPRDDGIVLAESRRSGHGNLERRMRMQNGENG